MSKEELPDDYETRDTVENFLRNNTAKIIQYSISLKQYFISSKNDALVFAKHQWNTRSYTLVIISTAFCLILSGFLYQSRDTVSSFFFSSGSSVNVPSEANIGVEVTLGHGRLFQFDEPIESVRLADPSIADINVVTPDQIYIFGKKLGTTNIIAMSGDAKSPSTSGDDKSYLPAQPKVQAALSIRVVADSAPANDALHQLAPAATAKINLFGRRAVATGRTRDIDDALGVANVAQTYSAPGQPPINATTVDGSQQVNLRVRFAEVSRSDMQTLGINWQLFNTGNFSFGLLKDNGSRHFDGNALVEALQRNGVLNVLAEPNLTAITGQTAKFLAGGEYPIPLPQGVEYKPFGVSLEFTPTIVKKNRIALHVHPEVSMVSTAGSVKINGFEAPAFMVRRADTTVEIASGQTFAIGGLFQRQLSEAADDVSKMPILGDAPIIGELFRSPRFRRNETELVILITPYLVNPVSDRMVATPLDKASSPAPDSPQTVASDTTSSETVVPKQKRKDTGKNSGMIMK